MSQANRHSVSVSAVIVDDGGRALVTQRRDNGRWEIPGGVLELDESIHTGLRREVREETGLLVEPDRLTGVYKNLTLGVVALVFRARIVAGQPGPTDETAAVAWWSEDEIRGGMVEAFAVRAQADHHRWVATPTRIVRTRTRSREVDLPVSHRSARANSLPIRFSAR